MAVDTQQILDEAEKLGRLVAQHPAIERYKQAQRAVADDPETSRTMAELNRQLEALARQQQAGMPVTDAQRQQLEAMEGRIVSNIKVKALNLAEVEFIDLLRKVTQTIQRPLVPEQAGAGAGGAGGAGGAATATVAERVAVTPAASVTDALTVRVPAESVAVTWNPWNDDPSSTDHVTGPTVSPSGSLATALRATGVPAVAVPGTLIARSGARR